MRLFGDFLQVGELVLHRVARPALGRAHDLVELRRHDAAVAGDHLHVVQTDGHAVEIRGMLGELVGVREDVRRRRAEHVEEKSDVFLLDSARRHRLRAEG